MMTAKTPSLAIDGSSTAMDTWIATSTRWGPRDRTTPPPRVGRAPLRGPCDDTSQWGSGVPAPHVHRRHGVQKPLPDPPAVPPGPHCQRGQNREKGRAVCRTSQGRDASQQESTQSAQQCRSPRALRRRGPFGLWLPTQRRTAPAARTACARRPGAGSSRPVWDVPRRRGQGQRAARPHSSPGLQHDGRLQDALRWAAEPGHHSRAGLLSAHRPLLMPRPAQQLQDLPVALDAVPLGRPRRASS